MLTKPSYKQKPKIIEVYELYFDALKVILAEVHNLFFFKTVEMEGWVK